MHSGDLLSAFADDELDAATRATVTAHLDGCEQCRQELAAVDVIRDRVRSLPAVEPPPGAFALPAPVIPLHRRRRILVTGAAAAAALIVAVGLGAGGGESVPLPIDAVVEQHVARASVDPGFNVLQVQAVSPR